MSAQDVDLVRVKAMLEAWRDWDSESDDSPPDEPLNFLGALLVITDHLLRIDSPGEERTDA